MAEKTEDKKPVLSPTSALAKLKILQEQWAAIAVVGEILEAARACEDPARRLAELKAEIEAATAERDKIAGDLGQAREAHQTLMGELGADESQRRQEIEERLAKARSEAAAATNLAKESQARAEAERDQAVKKAREETDAANAELARVRKALSELKGTITA